MLISRKIIDICQMRCQFVPCQTGTGSLCIHTLPRIRLKVREMRDLRTDGGRSAGLIRDYSCFPRSALCIFSVELRGFLTVLLELAWGFGLRYTDCTNQQLAERTGLSRSTVSKYLGFSGSWVLSSQPWSIQ